MTPGAAARPAVSRGTSPTTRIVELVGRAERPIAGLLVLVAALMLTAQMIDVVPRWHEIGWGGDRTIYMDATSRWLTGGPYYVPAQLLGTYSLPGLWILYPPPSLILFAPFTVLPAILWWIIPIGVITLVVVHHRPRPFALGAIALILANPTTISTLAWGNPGMWIAASLALGTVYGWPAVAVLLKPTLLPFALVGANRRSWWIALVVALVISLAFLPMWRDYIAALANLRTANNLGYSVPQVPLMLLPIAAWLGGRYAPHSPQRVRPSGTSLAKW